MNKEIYHGSNKFNGRNDRNSHSKFVSSAFSSPEDLSSYLQAPEKAEASGGFGEVTGFDIHHSNPRLDAYLFYFSSKL